MRIMIGNRKGGCGKSTLAVNIATWILANKTDDIVLLDADRQETAAMWLDDRDESEFNLKPITLVQKYGRIKNVINDLARKFEYTIIDVAGRTGDELVSAMGAVDVMVVPFKPSKSDFNTIPAMLDAIDDAKEINPNLRVIALLNMCNTSVTNRDENREWLDVLRRVEDFEIAPNIYDRKVFRDCLITGQGVNEMNNPKAKVEIESLMKMVLK